MPAHLTDSPLRLTFVFSSGRSHVSRLDRYPNQPLVRQLALGLENLTHPHGDVDAKGTAKDYTRCIGHIVRWLDLAGFSGTAADVTAAHMVGFWRSTDAVIEGVSRRLLRAVDAHVEPLREDVRKHLDGAPFRVTHNRDRQAYRSYSDGEWQRLVRCCTDIVSASWSEHNEAIKTATAGRDPAVAGWSEQNLLWLLHNRGALGQLDVAAHMGYQGRGGVVKRGGVATMGSKLFVTTDVALAYRLLLGTASGIVPDGLDDLELSDVDWAGDETVVLSYLKQRTGPESLNLPAPAVRILRQWLRHSAPIRGFAREDIRANLWLSYYPAGPGHKRVLAPVFQYVTVRSWVARYNLLGDDGQPLHLHKARIRTTFHQRRDKSRWTGRVTIDPNHSARVEGDHYLSAPTPAQQDSLEAVIEQAQADLIRKATTPLVLAQDDVEHAAARLPTELAGLRVTDKVIAELVGGQRDVFTAACADQLAGLHGPAGKPCPARPWVCLLCPLAVFAPRHAPNLLRLKAFFARSFRQMPAAHFMAVFGPYAQRLDEILPRFSPSILAAARIEVSDRDHELPLRPEETTS